MDWYYSYLNEMASDFGLDNDVRISVLSRFPEVFTMEDEQLDEEEVLIITANGQVEHIATNSITPIGRTGMGIIGIRLNEGDEVIGCEAVRDPADLLALFTENGYGKKTAVSEYNLQNRGGLGVKGYNLNKKTGKIVSSSMLNDSDTILIVGAASSLCILGADVPTSARVSRGSTLIKGTTIVSTSKI